MITPSKSLLRYLSLLFAMWLYVAQVAAQADKSHASNVAVSISGVSILPDFQRNGIHGIGITYKISGNIPPAEWISTSKTAPIWMLNCSLYDENRFPLLATTGRRRFSVNGFCKDSIALGTKALEAALQGDTLFFPYYAIAIDPGQQRIQASLQLIDLSNHQVLTKADYQPGIVMKPAMRMVRIQLERLRALTTNAKGEAWDYKIFNSKDAYPDLQWILRRGSEVAFEGEKQHNDTFYLGSVHDLSPWFFLSQGDKVQLQVVDFDLLGSSDEIGQMAIDFDKTSFASGVGYDFSFGRVHSVKLKIDAILPPKAAISGFEVVEDEHELGVSGLKIKLAYDAHIKTRNVDFLLGITLRTKEGNTVIRYPRIVGPGGMPTGDGMVLLTGEEGKLELFLPQYELLTMGADLQRHIRVDVISKLDGQSLKVASIERPWLGGQYNVNDMVFGQWKVSLHDRGGEAGVRLALDYEMPDGYFRDMPECKLSLMPQMRAPWGKVRNQDLIVLGAESVDWRDSLLILTTKNRKGTLDLFLPFHKAQKSMVGKTFAVNYRCSMVLDGKKISLGQRGFETEMELPPLQELHFAVREAAVRKAQWINAEPNLYWVLKIGETEVYRSSVQMKSKDARWPEEMEAKVFLSETDRIQLQVFHKGARGQQDKVIETWQATVATVPDKPKSNSRLKPETLKRLVVRSFLE